jgi:hypothetical protein
MIGVKFGRWTVIDDSMARKSNGYATLCKCDCGKKKLVQRTYLKKGRSKSCGCQGLYPGIFIDGNEVLSINKNCKDVNLKCKHGRVFNTRIINGRMRAKTCPCDRVFSFPDHGECHKTSEYECWRRLRQRCNNKNLKEYIHYGARGIKMCKRWDVFKNFLEDMGRKPKGFSIERKDVNGDYSPENCVWANWNTQANNKRNSIKFFYLGENRSMKEISEITGTPVGRLWQRFYKCNDINIAISMPLQKNKIRR